MEVVREEKNVQVILDQTDFVSQLLSDRMA
jgi:hypothetical protein